MFVDMSPRLFYFCVALVVGPPVAVVALNYDLLKPKLIDPRTAVGEVLFFEANWCGACKAMKPVVVKLRNDGFDIRTVDVDSHRDEAIRFGIHAVPTFILMRGGDEVRRESGMVSPDTLQSGGRNADLTAKSRSSRDLFHRETLGT